MLEVSAHLRGLQDTITSALSQFETKVS